MIDVRKIIFFHQNSYKIFFWIIKIKVKRLYEIFVCNMKNNKKNGKNRRYISRQQMTCARIASRTFPLSIQYRQMGWKQRERGIDSNFYGVSGTALFSLMHFVWLDSTGYSYVYRKILANCSSTNAAADVAFHFMDFHLSNFQKIRFSLCRQCFSDLTYNIIYILYFMSMVRFVCERFRDSADVMEEHNNASIVSKFIESWLELKFN